MVKLSHFDGAVDVDRLIAAFADVVKRSDTLSSRVVDDGSGPVVLPTTDAAVTEVLDVSRRDAEAWAQRRLAAPIDVAVRPYDSVVLRHELEIELANHLPQAVAVEVRERLPHVPEGVEDVQFELGSVSPRWQDYEQKEPPLSSGRAWKVEVPAGGQRKLAASWSATIPKDHELVGGNRRES